MAKDNKKNKNKKQPKVDFGEYILYKITFEIIPALFLIGVVFYFLVEFFGWKATELSEKYNIFFAAIGITATLSVLSFSASSCTENNEEKQLFKKSGENFLFSVVFFIIVIIMHYVLSLLNFPVIINENSTLTEKILFYLNGFKLIYIGGGAAKLFLGMMTLKDALMGCYEWKIKTKAND
jgi:hypothetical protein